MTVSPVTRRVPYRLFYRNLMSRLTFSNVPGKTYTCKEEYFPYGETSFGSFGRFGRKRYRFTGKERDEESGLYYHGARYYAPWLARWVSCDPAGRVDGLNLYGYAMDRPLLLSDPSGTQATSGAEKVEGWKAANRATFQAREIDARKHGKTLEARPLGQYRSPQDLEADRPPFGGPIETGWKIGELLYGETVSGYKIDRQKHFQQISRRLIEHALDIQAAGDLAKIPRTMIGAYRELSTASTASKELLAWGRAWDARRTTFVQATAAAQTATGTSHQLGNQGVNLALRLYGGPGTGTEVTVEVGRRMDIAPTLPWQNTSAEWEVKLVQPRNLYNQHTASEISRDIARQQRYGASAEVGWISWRGLPKTIANRLESGGVMAVDAPKLAAEISAARDTSWFVRQFK